MITISPYRPFALVVALAALALPGIQSAPDPRAQTRASLARQAALDLAKVTKDEEGAAAWIEIAEVWRGRADPGAGFRVWRQDAG